MFLGIEPVTVKKDELNTHTVLENLLKSDLYLMDNNDEIQIMQETPIVEAETLYKQWAMNIIILMFTSRPKKCSNMFSF